MLRKGHILAILVIAVSFVTVPAFAQEYLVTSLIIPDLGHSYNERDVITVSGEVVGIMGSVDEPVTIKIFYYGEETFRDNKKQFITEKVSVSQDGSFTKTFDLMTKDKSWRQGEYSLEVSIGSWMSKERFFSLDVFNNLSNGCPRHFPDVLSDGLCYDLPEPEPVKEPAGMGFYENELYDFSFSIPMDWRYIENYLLPDGSTFQVILYPAEFDPLASAYASPVIFLGFESIPESSIRNLNEQEIERFELEELRIALPNAKIINSDVKSTSWGWEGTFEFVVNLNVPFVVQGDYHEINKVFYFKNRESYTVGYLSPIEYFDSYHHVYEDVVNSTVINGVVVPEFQEIALMVLGSSIVLVIVFARKFRVNNLGYS